jgi:hypothetical protein
MKTRNRLVLRLAAVLLWMPIALQATPVFTVHASSRTDRQDDGGLVQHIISPQATDPEIDTFTAVGEEHYIWANPAQQSDSMLWVFLPSTAATPREFQLIAKEAARIGYHVISLMYPNRDAVVDICNPLPDLEQRESCYENIRLQTLDGIERSHFTNVNPANSIDNRLTKLLMYLAANFPEEGWKHFLNNGAPRWSRIAVAGHSQGGGNAAMIGKLHRVARVVMLSSPVDGCVAPPLRQCVRGNPDQAARWVAIGATPADRYYGLGHRRDFGIKPLIANWNALGLDVFGAPVAPETSAPPYGCTHMLVTELNPNPVPNVSDSVRAHRSTARDAYTPLSADGTPALRDAWRYISANPEDDSCESETERL